MGGRPCTWASARTDLTATLKKHEVTQPVEYAQVTNATYTGLTGKTAAELKQSKGLKKSASLRDAMSTKELVFVMAAEQLAQERIQDENSRGVVRCSSAAERSASFIRKAIEATGLSARSLGLKDLVRPVHVRLAPSPLRFTLARCWLRCSFMGFRRHPDHRGHYPARNI